MPTFVKEFVHSGAETLNDQLSGTPVDRAGPNGMVYAGFGCSDGTCKATLRGKSSGKLVIATNSGPNVGATAELLTFENSHMIFVGQVNPNEELELQVVAAAASTSKIVVRV